MNQLIFAWMIVIVALLGSLAPFLPGDNNDPLGFGGFSRAWDLNQKITAKGEDRAAQRAKLLFRGRLTRNQLQKIEQAVMEVLSQETDGPQYVQARGFPRNVIWMLAYDFYPVRVIGHALEEGGRPNDPVMPEANWVLTNKHKRISLDRAP